MNPGSDLRAAIVREKLRLKTFILRSKDASARGYAAIDQDETLILKCVFDMGTCGERHFRETLANLWPGSTWGPFDGDFVAFLQPLVVPLEEASPLTKARFFNALEGRGFRRMRIAFGGQERAAKEEENELEPMPVAV